MVIMLKHTTLNLINFYFFYTRCNYNSTNLWVFNLPYSGCDPYLDLGDNLWNVPVWRSNNTYINRSTAILINSTYNLPVLQSDLNRLNALKIYEEQFQIVALPSFIQGLVLISVSSISQVIFRVARLKFQVIAKFKWTLWEAINGICFFLLVCVAFIVISLNSSNYHVLFGPLMYTLLVTVFFLFLSTWRICKLSYTSKTIKNRPSSKSMRVIHPK